MKLVKIKNVDSQEFRKAWKIYESSFSFDERRSLEMQKEVMKNKRYNFFVAIKGNTVVGILTYWKLDDFLFVEHLAVREDLRGQGIGREIMTQLLKNKQKIILEVERPENEIAIKRINFYEKLGFKLNKFNYIQPSYGKNKKPVPMFLMSYPRKIDNSEFYSMRKQLYIVVYRLEELPTI